MVQVAGGSRRKDAGWVLQISSYKSDTFIRRPDDMIEAIPKEEPEQEGSND